MGFLPCCSDENHATGKPVGGESEGMVSRRDKRASTEEAKRDHGYGVPIANAPVVKISHSLRQDSAKHRETKAQVPRNGNELDDEMGFDRDPPPAIRPTRDKYNYPTEAQKVAATQASRGRAGQRLIGWAALAFRRTDRVTVLITDRDWNRNEQIFDSLAAMWAEFDSLEDPSTELWESWTQLVDELCSASAASVMANFDGIAGATFSGLEHVPGFDAMSLGARSGLGLTRALTSIQREIGFAAIKTVEAISSVFFLAKPLMVLIEAYRYMDDALIDVKDLVGDIISLANNLWSILLSGVGERCREIEKSYGGGEGMLEKLTREVRTILNMIIAFDTRSRPTSTTEHGRTFMRIRVTASALKKAMAESKDEIIETPELDEVIKTRQETMANSLAMRLKRVNAKLAYCDKALSNKAILSLDNLAKWQRRRTELRLLQNKLEDALSKDKPPEVAFWIKVYPTSDLETDFLRCYVLSPIHGVQARVLKKLVLAFKYEDVLAADSDWVPKEPFKAMVAETYEKALAQHKARAMKEKGIPAVDAKGDDKKRHSLRVVYDFGNSLKKKVSRQCSRLVNGSKYTASVARNLYMAIDHRRVLTKIKTRLEDTLNAATFQSTLMILDTVTTNNAMISVIHKSYECYKKIQNEELRNIWAENFPQKTFVQIEDLAPALANWYIKDCATPKGLISDEDLREEPDDSRKANQLNKSYDLIIKFTNILIYLDSNKGHVFDNTSTDASDGKVHYLEANIWFPKGESLRKALDDAETQAEEWEIKQTSMREKEMEDLTAHFKELKTLKDDMLLTEGQSASSKDIQRHRGMIALVSGWLMKTEKRIHKLKLVHNRIVSRAYQRVHNLLEEGCRTSLEAFQASVTMLATVDRNCWIETKGKRLYKIDIENQVRSRVSDKATLKEMNIMLFQDSLFAMAYERLTAEFYWKLGMRYLGEAVFDYEDVESQAIIQYGSNIWDEMEFLLFNKKAKFDFDAKEIKADNPLQCANLIAKTYHRYGNVKSPDEKRLILFERYILSKNIYNSYAADNATNNASIYESMREAKKRLSNKLEPFLIRSAKKRTQAIRKAKTYAANLSIKDFEAAIHDDNDVEIWVNQGTELAPVYYNEAWNDIILPLARKFDSISWPITQQDNKHYELSFQSENVEQDVLRALEGDVEAILLLQQMAWLEQAHLYAERVVNSEPEEKREATAKRMMYIEEHLGLLYIEFDDKLASQHLEKGITLNSNICRYNMNTHLKNVCLKEAGFPSYDNPQWIYTYQRMETLLKDAANCGHIASAWRLATYYLTSRPGIARNLDEAKKYLSVAHKGHITPFALSIAEGDAKNKRRVLERFGKKYPNDVFSAKCLEDMAPKGEMKRHTSIITTRAPGEVSDYTQSIDPSDHGHIPYESQVSPKKLLKKDKAIFDAKQLPKSTTPPLELRASSRKNLSLRRRMHSPPAESRKGSRASITSALDTNPTGGGRNFSRQASNMSSGRSFSRQASNMSRGRSFSRQSSNMSRRALYRVEPESEMEWKDVLTAIGAWPDSNGAIPPNTTTASSEFVNEMNVVIRAMNAGSSSKPLLKIQNIATQAAASWLESKLKSINAWPKSKFFVEDTTARNIGELKDHMDILVVAMKAGSRSGDEKISVIQRKATEVCFHWLDKHELKLTYEEELELKTKYLSKIAHFGKGGYRWRSCFSLTDIYKKGVNADYGKMVDSNRFVVELVEEAKAEDKKYHRLFSEFIMCSYWDLYALGEGDQKSLKSHMGDHIRLYGSTILHNIQTRVSEHGEALELVGVAPELVTAAKTPDSWQNYKIPPPVGFDDFPKP